MVIAENKFDFDMALLKLCPSWMRCANVSVAWAKLGEPEAADAGESASARGMPALSSADKVWDHLTAMAVSSKGPKMGVANTIFSKLI